MDKVLESAMESVADRIEYFLEQEDNGITFIRYYSDIQIDANNIGEFLMKKHYKRIFCIEEYRQDKMYDGFEPFLPWIRELYNRYFASIPLSEFLDNCEIYPMHKSMMERYIQTGSCLRDEPIIVSEVKYEQQRIVDTIVRIIDYMSNRRKLIFILTKCHLASLSVCELLKHIINSGMCKKLVLIVGYNELYHVPIYMRKSWGELIKLISNEKYMVEWSMMDDTEPSVPENYIPQSQYMEEYIVKLLNYNSLLCLQQAENFSSMVRQMIEFEPVAENLEMDFYEAYAKLKVYEGAYKEALQICDHLRNYPSFPKSLERQFAYNQIQVIGKVYGGQRNSAFQNVIKCNEIAKKIGDEKLEFQSHILRCIVELDGWKDVSYLGGDIMLPENFIQQAEKYHFMNHMAYILIFGFTIQHLGVTTENDLFSQGVQIAEKLCNEEACLIGWKRMTMFASYRGKSRFLSEYYTKCLQIMHDNHREDEEAELYNGTGYLCAILEDYNSSDGYFQKALSLFCKLEKPAGVAESLYNIALSCMNVSNYNEAERCVLLAIEILRATKMERIRVANISKLYGILSVCYGKMNREYNQRLYYDKMKNVMSHILNKENPDISKWEDDVFIYNLAGGIIAAREEKYEKAEKMFRSAEQILEQYGNNQFYVSVIFIIEMEQVLRHLGKEKEAHVFIDKMKKRMEENHQHEKVHKIEAYVNQHPVTEMGHEICLSEEKEEEIRTMLNTYVLRQEIDRKTKAISFYENWVEQLGKSWGSAEELVDTAMHALENNFDIDKLVFIEIENDFPKIIYCDRNYPPSGYQIQGAVRYFTQNPRKLVVTRFNNNYYKYYDFVDLFGRDSLFSVFGIPVFRGGKLTHILLGFRMNHMNFTKGLQAFTEEEMDIFRTNFRQLLSAIERRKIKAKLEETSITDMQTGLLNRQGMKRAMDELIRGENRKFTILFMDLDNFKYCNDHFGHETGDEVLVLFAGMLRQIVSDKMVLARYGGDEFVVIIPEADVSKGMEIAEKIIYSLQRRNGFYSEIQDFCKKEIKLEKENQISSSIGIASDICMNQEDLSALLVKADEALYRVKGSVKGNYEVWQ